MWLLSWAGTTALAHARGPSGLHCLLPLAKNAWALQWTAEARTPSGWLAQQNRAARSVGSIDGGARVNAGEAASVARNRGLGGGEKDLGFKPNSSHTRRRGFAVEFWAHGGVVVRRLG
jgi:hypothetical protein